ncbi:MAG: hypothetical protein R3C46_01945 [Hyphomonadaceae bacterium]
MTPQAVLSVIRCASIAAAVMLMQACEVEAYTASCSRDDQIPPETREDIESAAIRIIGTLDQSPEQFAGILSSRGKIDAKPEAISTVIATYKSMSPVSEPTIAQTFFVTSSASTDFSAGIPCGTDDDGRMTFAPRGGTITNAVVLADQNIRGNSKVTHTLWLENEDSNWLIRGFHTGVSAIAGLDGEQLWILAKQQREKGNAINASLLYTAASNAFDRGPFFQPSIMLDFIADKQTFEQPRSVEFVYGQETFAVTDVLYIGLSNYSFAIGLSHTPTGLSEECRGHKQMADCRIRQGSPEWAGGSRSCRRTRHRPLARSNKGALNCIFAESGHSTYPCRSLNLASITSR